MYLKKHTVLQKLFSEKYHWGGGSSSQGAPRSLWLKHKLTAWWRRDLTQLWEAYAWETAAPHIPQCCRDFFFSQENVIWNIFTTELNRDCEIEQALLICLSFLVNILLVFLFFVFLWFFLFFVSFSFCINFYQSMQLQCPWWRMHNKPYFFFLKKKKTSFCIKRYICHISPCSTGFKTILSKIQ